MRALYGIAFLLILGSEQTFAQNWIPVSEEFSQQIVIMYHDPVSDHLFIGGQFGYLGSDHVGGIVSFDGSDFYDYGCAYDCEEPYTELVAGASGMASFNDVLYLKGVSWADNSWDSLFNKLPNTNGMIKYENNEFSGLDVPFESGEFGSNIVIDFVVDDTLYVLANHFGNVAGFEGYGGAKYDGDQWYPFALPHCCGEDSYTDLLKYNGELYISGNFAPVFGDPLPSDIAKLVNEEWVFLGEGIAGAGSTSISGMEIYQDDLYAFGSFQRDAGNAGEGIMKWNGEEWSDLGSGIIDGTVTDAVVFQDELFICGDFDEVEGILTQGVAKWNGNQWCDVGSNFYTSFISQKLAVYHDELYISSREEIGNVSLYKWNGEISTCSTEFNSVSEVDAFNNLSIYPNPSNEQLTVHLPKTLSGTSTLIIYDSLGKKVSKLTEFLNAENQIEIALTNLPSGLYSLQLRHEEVIGFTKFIKE